MSINKSIEDAQEAKNYFNYYIKDLGKIFNKVIGQIERKEYVDIPTRELIFEEIDVLYAQAIKAMFAGDADLVRKMSKKLQTAINSLAYFGAFENNDFLLQTAMRLNILKEYLEKEDVPRSSYSSIRRPQVLSTTLSALPNRRTRW